MSKTYVSHKQSTLLGTKCFLVGFAAMMATTLTGLQAQAVTLNAGDILLVDEEAFGEAGGVIRVEPTTGIQTPVSSGGLFVDPQGIAIDASGNIFVVDDEAFEETGGVIRVDPITGVQTPISSHQFFEDPVGIAVVPVPEPSSTLGLLMFGAFGASAILKRQLKKQKLEDLTK